MIPWLCLTVGLLSTPPEAPAPGLEVLLAHAEAHAPALRVADAERARAEAAQVEAAPWAPADPTLEIGAGLRRADGIGVDYDVRLSQPLDLSGERGLRREAARAERDAAEANRAAARWRLRGEIYRAVVESWVQSDGARWASRAAALADRLAESADRRIEAGAAPAADRVLAGVERRAARARALDFEQRAAATREALALRIGWTGALPPIAGALPPVEPPPPLASYDAALSAHPRVARAEALRRAAAARLAAIERSRWPDPTVAVGYARESSTGAEPGADIWSAAVGLPLPLWHSADGPVAAARAEIAQFAAEADAVAATLRARVAEERAAVERAAARVALLDEGMADLRAHGDRVQAAYADGAVDLMRVVEVRRVQLDAERRLFEAQADYHRAASRLAALVGLPDVAGEADR